MTAQRLNVGGCLAILIAILSFHPLTTLSHAQDYAKEKGGDVLLITAEVLLAADMLQTQYILKSKDYDELNPILDMLGPNGAPIYFLFYAITVPLLGEILFPEYREWIYSCVVTTETFAVGNNISIGVGFSF